MSYASTIPPVELVNATARYSRLRYLILDGAPEIKVAKGQWRRWLSGFVGPWPLRGEVLLRMPNGKILFTEVASAAAGACIYRRRHEIDMLVFRRRLAADGKWVGVPGARYGHRPLAQLSAVGTVAKCPAISQTRAFKRWVGACGLHGLASDGGGKGGR